MISFIIGTNKRPGCLATLVANLRAQTVPVEIVVMDEGADYATFEASADADIYCRIPFHGTYHYEAKNLGVHLASNDTLCFPQDDAEYSLEFAEKMEGEPLMVCGWIWKGRPLPPNPVYCGVDIGGFTITEELFWRSNGFTAPWNEADGRLVERAHDYSNACLVTEKLYVKSD